MEKSNNEIYEKLIEGFNKILSETSQLRQDTLNIIDKNDPNYLNIRNIYDLCFDTKQKVDSIESRLKKNIIKD